MLGGMILGLLAQDTEPLLAAAASGRMHAAAAQKFGPGHIGEDLPEFHSGVLRDLYSLALT